MKSAVALRHVHFEGLGTFEKVLSEAGYSIRYVDIGQDELEPFQTDLLIVLGAPVGVYEDDAYPFLKQERELLATRLGKKLPTLGICLGAQQIAATLGAKVGPSGFKEIGFAPVQLTEAGKASPLHHLDGVPMLHWHGDMFEIPNGATRLAGTAICPNQAFSIGNHVLGLQFHPEADASQIESWLIGHAAELAAANIDPRTIRSDAHRYGTVLREAARTMFEQWLRSV